jgi:exosome complex component RRP41
MPVAYLSNADQVTLLQLDGRLSPTQFSECLNKAIHGCKLVYEIQKEALMKKYFGDEVELKEEL